MFRYLPLILKNCWRNRRRTLLTIASIGVSMCLLGVMIAMFHAMYLSDAAPEQALRLVTRNRVSLTVVMPQSYQAAIRQIPGVREVMISQWFGGTYIDAKHFFARFAVEPEKLFGIYGELTIPDDQRKAFERDRTGCVVGRDLANKYNFHVGDRITLVGDIFPGDFPFTIRGIFDSPRASEVLYFSRDYLEQSMEERRRGTAGMFTTLIDNPASATRIAEAIDNEYRNATAQTKTESEQAFALSFVSMIGNVKMFLVAISAAVMFTILLVSANTMAMSVRERVREVGVLKTLGFTPGAILGMILGEALAISLIGGTIGFLLSTGLASGVSKAAGGLLPSIPSFQPAVAAACILTAAVIGLASSLVPAMGASRIPIVDALRSTD
ncbi:MAG TPA: FtsX-like permease family protein [Candidatus Acidoferrales bacterium]|jgi:putative ABC transport system permease protein|nr:FtsX-like permease family protein [Candidatus Acidoferrales bacterium]